METFARWLVTLGVLCVGALGCGAAEHFNRPDMGSVSGGPGGQTGLDGGGEDTTPVFVVDAPLSAEDAAKPTAEVGGTDLALEVPRAPDATDVSVGVDRVDAVDRMAAPSSDATDTVVAADRVAEAATDVGGEVGGAGGRAAGAGCSCPTSQSFTLGLARAGRTLRCRIHRTCAL